jgi:hypothetical protein
VGIFGQWRPPIDAYGWQPLLADLPTSGLGHLAAPRIAACLAGSIGLVDRSLFDFVGAELSERESTW